MPWKDGYTISDETSLTDSELHWPDGQRLCVSIVVDLSVASKPDGITARDLMSDRAQFAAHDGLDGLLAVLRRFGLKATFAVPAIIAELRAERMRALLAEGHEIAAQGLRHEDVSGLDRAEEAARLARTTGILTRVCGRQPAGWFSLPRQGDPFAGGTISPHTVDLLIEAGYAYFGNGLADDIPHYWVTDFATARSLPTLPYYYHFDDQFFCMFPSRGTGLENPDMLVRNWRAELAAQYKRGRYFGMTLHPHHIGWCDRLQLLEDFLTHMTSLPGIWNPIAAECLRHWTASFPPARHLRLQPSIWQDHPGSLS